MNDLLEEAFKLLLRIGLWARNLPSDSDLIKAWGASLKHAGIAQSDIRRLIAEIVASKKKDN